MLPFVPRHLTRCLLIGACGVCVSVGAAQLPSGGPLARSPFLPPDSAGGPAAVAPNETTWQFSGILGTGPGALYCLVNTQTHRSHWLPLGGEAAEGLVVRDFDAANDTLVVQTGGGPTVSLRLQSVQTGVTGPTAMNNTPRNLPATGPAASGPAASGPQSNATPATEAERLRAVAEEVRRRRALRQATIEQQAAQAAARGN